jgi:hypothetical protein
MREQRDFGLLILRIAGFLLVFTFGIQKIGWYWSALHAGKSFNRIGAADRKNGFPNPGRAGYVDHVQRINRRVSHRVRVFDKIICGQSHARNGRGALYQCSTRRRLAQGGALPNHLRYLDLHRSWQIFPGSPSKAQKISRRMLAMVEC